MSDKEILQSKQWLNDGIIYAGMKLLEKESNPSKIEGWQSTQRGKDFKFKVLPLGAKFVQICHVSRNHWIVASNVKCTDNSVRIYDSLSDDDPEAALSLDVQKQVCCLLRPVTKSLAFDIVNVKQQNTSYDCGIFALAYATELALNKEPLSCNLSSCTDILRTHLLQCFEANKMAPFPQSQRERRVAMGSRIKYHKKVEVYCQCRMPYDPECNMVECCTCTQWFHLLCVGETRSVKDLEKRKWNCPKCSSLCLL